MRAKFVVGDTLVTGDIPKGEDLATTDRLLITNGEDQWSAVGETLIEMYTPVSELGKHYQKAIEENMDA